jgi:hypothetical protein
MSQPGGPDAVSAQRRARREFIRTHHPDVGGDPHTFVTGLADLDAGPRPSTPARSTAVTVTARQAWPVSLTTVMLRRLRRRHQPPRVR